ncbi:hypothetical protein ACF046_11655 [Glutamicibacter creatinolyticus]|uniref:Uncharacterized protein n=1 Tax=Glutamicibacter creatinolyticus TaxID=162496 RepID=A0A5B7WTQ7_9MICC|nr:MULTISPECIES: hypothetical protein [Micrococcaceae]QCY47292.1 hypothetical protein GcLGCM259_1561 [Glutamicibacter creatinolyticus]TLK56571.1 hypothetical protein FDN03_03850 [Glutamicibacter sp. V16R2B1]
MSKTKKSFKEVEKSLKKLAKNAKTEIPQELKESWSKAIAGVDAGAISDAGANLVSNVTGNSKAAKRTRSSVEDAVNRAQKALNTQKKGSKGRKFLMFLVVAGVAVAAAVAANKKTATS